MSGIPITGGFVKDDSSILTGFALALGQIGAVVKAHTADAGTYTYAYANLADTLSEVKRVCNESGLTISQNVSVKSTDAGDWVTVATTLYDQFGGWLTWEPLHVKPGADPQKMGSAITYAKRYALTALFCIPTADDDGAQARDSIVEDNEELQATAARSKRAAAAVKKLKALSDDEKQSMRDGVQAEFGRPFLTSELATDETLLVYVELCLP
jgi:hypothetical protein